MTRKKLIEQYQEKIKNCDTLLASCKKHRQKLRHDGNVDKPAIYENIKDRAIHSAQRQCHVQFIHDLKDELDETECLLYVDPEKSCQALRDRKKELNLSMNCEREDWLHPEELDDIDLLTD